MKSLFFQLFFLLSTVLHAQASSDDWTTLHPESLSPEWAEFQEQIAARPWVVADFEERREFSFRRDPVDLTGSVWFGRKEGLTLNYQSPRREVVRIDEEGVSVIRNGRTRTRNLPEEGRNVPAALLSLFRLEFAALAESFAIQGHRDGTQWELRLTPRDAEEAPIQRLELGGTGEEVQRILIEQNATRRIELTFSDTVYPEELDDETRARVFP